MKGRHDRYAGYFQAKRQKRYLFTVIDLFSKFAQAIPVNFKDAKAITTAFGLVLTCANPRLLRCLHTDNIIKFFNSNFQALIQRHGIQHFASESEQKAVVVERLNRNIKPGYGHICRIALLSAGRMSSMTSMMLTTTRVTAPLAWRQLMSNKKTRTVSECVSSKTNTLTLNNKFLREHWCGPAATIQFMTKNTFPTEPRSILHESGYAT